MKLFLSLLLAGLAQAGTQVTSHGVTFTVTRTKDGVEVPADMGPQLGMDSKGPVKAKGGSKAKGKRQSVSESTNWCGMVDTSAPSGTWHNVVGTWTVPQISLRSGQSDSDSPSIAQWVGIDGDGCGTGLIQGGTVSQLNTDGSQTNYAWFEFVPNPLSSIQLTVNTGDSIFGNVTATGTNTGFVEIINNSSGEGLNVAITDGPGTLCGYSAEWILEDLTGGNGLLPFAEFPNSAFSGTLATTDTGATGTAANANPIDLEDASGANLCTAAYDSGSGNIDITSTS